MGATDDKKKFAIYMALLGTAFGEHGISTARIDVYWDQLRDIPVDLVGAAVSRILKTRKYASIPTIAEIREAALGRDEDIDTAALEAWGRAAYAVERGHYPLPDEAVNEAVRVAFGGWEKFGQTDPESSMADRAHFLKVYRGQARGRRDRGELALPARETRLLGSKEDAHE
jgi:hypothetical protein